MNSLTILLIVMVTLSCVSFDETKALNLGCGWGGCPSHGLCNACCDRLRKGCTGGRCIGFLRCECNCHTQTIRAHYYHRDRQ